MQSTWIFLLLLGIILPQLYLFVMIQYGGITFPYWDHLPTAKYVIKYFDGTLTFHDLLETHNESRPLFPRLIFVATAALTNWDVRAEYIYIYLTVYGVFAALLVMLRRLSTDWPVLVTLTTALLFSILACSPVSAMNHFWSLMLFGTLSCLASTVAFLAVSMRPYSWPANIAAAALGWIGTYSLSQGLFVFPAILIVHQMIAKRPYAVTRWSIFWLVNLVVCYTVYIRGSYIDGSVPPTLVNFIGFIVVYLGNPLGSLLWYPEMDVVWLPETSIINAICGVLLLALGARTAWKALFELKDRRPETLIFFLLAAYAGACTVVTGWGRAVGDYPIATANSSRYSIFAVCYLFALIFYYAPKFGRRELAFTAWHKAALVVFVLASAVSYVRAIPVYKSAHDDNAWLADAYSPHAEQTDFDSRVFPAPDYFSPKRADMLRLGIGPYRSISERAAPIYAGAFQDAIPVAPGITVQQRFRSARPYIRSISFPVVTWAKTPNTYQIHWKVVGIDSGATLGEGKFDTKGLKDWQIVKITLNGAIADREAEASFAVEGDGAVQFPVGLALYPAAADQPAPAKINGKARESGVLALTVHYEQ